MTAEGRILSASLWSILGETCVAGAGVVSFFVYAAFLSPGDFGIVAFCLVWMSLFQMLVDNSLRLAVVRSRGPDQVTLDVAFRGNVTLALVSYLLVVGAALPAAAILHDQRVLLVLPIMALQLLCGGFSATYLAIAQRRFDFRVLFRVRLMSTFGSLGVGLVLALAGFAYWSLVAAGLASGLIQLIASWRAVSWRPGSSFSWAVASPLYRFAAWMAADMAMTWAAMWSGGFVLGCFRGEHELGLYRLGEQAANAAIGTVVDPLNPVFYATYCDPLNGKEEQARSLAAFCRIMALLVPPLAIIVILASRPVEGLLGVRWSGLAQLMILSALGRAASTLPMPVMPYLRARGHSKVVACARLFIVAVQIPVFLLTAPLGVTAFMRSVVAVDAAMYFLYFMAVAIVSKVHVAAILLRQLAFAGATLIFASIAYLVDLWLGAKQPAAFATALALFAVLYGTFLFIGERQFLNSAWAVVWRRLTETQRLPDKHDQRP